MFSQPSLHLGPSCQLVDAGRQLSLSLHLGRSRQPVDETRGCARAQAQYRPGPSRTTTQTTSTPTTTKDLCLTTTMTWTDDRRLLRTVIADAAWSCRMVSSSVSRAIVFSSCPLSLSLSLSLSPLSVLLVRHSPSLSQDHSVGLVQCHDPSTISARTQAERRHRRHRPRRLLRTWA